MIKLMVKIGTVDTYAYLGRDHHPERSDAGRTVEVMSLTLQRFATDPFDDIDFVLARFDDGRLVELVEHEIESMTFSVVPDDEPVGVDADRAEFGYARG